MKSDNLKTALHVREAMLDQESTPNPISFWRKYDDFMLGPDWSVLDQIRLLSIDYLFRRSFEFHNNHHTFHCSGDFDYTSHLPDLSPTDIAVQLMRFSFGRYLLPPRYYLYYLSTD
jgi:hypothetical protein